MFDLPHFGIDIELYKEPARSGGILRINRPSEAFVPLRIGGKDFSPAALHSGDKLQKGQILAVSEEGYELASPFAGIFIGISEKKHPLYRTVPCVHIETEENPAAEERAAADVSALTPEEIISAAKRAPVVDELSGRLLGELLEEMKDGRCGAVALSSFDTQPYVSSGGAVLAEYGAEVSAGARLISAAVGGAEPHILTYGETADAFAESIDGVRVINLCGRYPYTPPLPDDTFYAGIQAARALYRACAYAEPHGSTVVTVSGPAAESPVNIETEIGVPVIELVGQCGFRRAPGKIAANGVLSGRVISPAATVYPGLASLTLTERTSDAASECIGCGRCVQVCPTGVAPYYVLRDYLAENIRGAGFRRAERCTDCGLCSYVCPSGIDLMKLVRRASAALEKAKREGRA